MKSASKKFLKVTMVIGFIIVLLNLVYFFVYKDSFFNKNTISGVLIIIFSLYFYEKD